MYEGIGVYIGPRILISGNSVEEPPKGYCRLENARAERYARPDVPLREIARIDVLQPSVNRQLIEPYIKASFACVIV